ncbi:hypothetical protein ACFL6U_25550 [Planctomycetota bacterium]
MLRQVTLWYWQVLLILCIQGSLFAQSSNVQNIDLLLDIGQYIIIDNQVPIKLKTDLSSSNPFQTYEGCRVTPVTCNFAFEISTRIEPIAETGGNWTSTVSPVVVTPATANIEICVRATDVQIGNLPGGAKDYKVAELIVYVIPIGI